MTVWPYLMALSSFTVIAAAISGRGHYSSTSVYIFVAYCAMIAAKHFPINGEAPLVFYAAIWVVASGAIWRHTTIMAGNDGVPIFIPAAIASIGLCYFIARLMGLQPIFLSPPFVASDVLAVLAMLCIWWGIRNELVDWVVGTWRVGFDSSDCVGFDNCRSGDTMAQENGPKEVSRNA